MSVDLATAGAAIAASNMWKLSRLGLVLEATERARVPVIVLKGAALLDWLFALEERPMADVDCAPRSIGDCSATLRANRRSGRQRGSCWRARRSQNSFQPRSSASCDRQPSD